MKDLSVIIVNYNVEHFLEQCLLSVKKASEGLATEIFVVDNNSVDGSVEMVKEKFPLIHLIENKTNTGFSKANNQAIAQATGRYVLLLNPDTVVEEETFTKIIAFMDSHPDAGALGVKMIDGEGKFLPESKRGLPNPEVAFYKIFGLQKFFPKSRRFGKYYLSHLDPDKTHEIEVLSGAFMLLRKETLDKIGWLDEDFFMYGEDIDLSYRVMLGGWKNYYFPETRIIHYKGESTKKGSLNYVKVFYNAMIIFAGKHFNKGSKTVYVFFIHLAIYLRAFISVLNRFRKGLSFPLLEMALIYLSIIGVKHYWETAHKLLMDGIPYPSEFEWVAAPVYTMLFSGFLWALGAYRKPFRFRPILEASLSGFVAIATITYIVKDINFSRVIVGMSSLAVVFIAASTRAIYNFSTTGSFIFTQEQKRRAIIVADENEAERIRRLIRSELEYPVEMEGAVFPGLVRPSGNSFFIGTVSQLKEIVSIYRIEEVIFSGASLSTLSILDMMSNSGPREVRYKIVPPGADYLVGPQVIHSSLYGGAGFFPLGRKEERRKKRAFDIGFSTGLLILFPLFFWLYNRPFKAFRNLMHVLRGENHLVGYIKGTPEGLPEIKRGLLNMLHRLPGDQRKLSENVSGLDRHYARSYSLSLDFEILMKGLRNLGEERALL